VEDKEQNPFFPMEIGKHLLYYTIPDGSYCDVCFSKDTCINGKKYCIIQTHHWSGNKKSYATTIHGNIWMRETPKDSGQLVFPKCDSTHKRYHYYFRTDESESKAEIISINDSITTPTGNHKNLINIYTERMLSSDTLRINEFYARDTGLIAMEVNSQLYSYLLRKK
jgi:hypothetical protein